MEGYTPEYEMDHINRIPNDNRWQNIRHVTPTCNHRNKNIMSTNTSGVTGVTWYKPTQKWTSQICVNGKVSRLGYFQNFKNAVKARWKAEVKHNWPECNSGTSAYLWLKENEHA